MPDDLENLEKKLEELRGSERREKEREAADMDSKANPGMRAGSEFLSQVIAAGILGYIIDRFAGTMPWGMILMLLLGFAGGVYRANKTMNDNK